jgi:hypothetical protein
VSRRIGADLRAEPLVLTVPPSGEGRYYSLQFVDGYTYNFDYVGSRTSAAAHRHVPARRTRLRRCQARWNRSVIQSDTDVALVIYRTQLLNPSAVDNVKKI